jgi:hypothetical protein
MRREWPANASWTGGLGFVTLPRLSWHDDSMICCRLPPPLQVLPLLRLMVHYFVLVEVVEELLLYVVLQLSYVHVECQRISRQQERLPFDAEELMLRLHQILVITMIDMCRLMRCLLLIIVGGGLG